MPTRPRIVTMTNSSVDVLNAIRNNASINYQNYVPVATNDPESIREIGAIIMDFPNLQNEFLSALINRIGRVILTSKLYENPLAMFKKGMLEFGETVEEIFVDIAKPFEYDPAVAESNIFKRQKPDVRSAFHVLNYQKFYKATIQQNDLKKAFLSWGGVDELIAKIVDAMYTAANYDEFLTTKYMLARHILKGQLYPISVGTVNPANAKGVVTTIKGVSNDIEFPSRKYNLAGVQNYTIKENQYLLVNSKFDAMIDVEVLASAFNMSKAEFMGKRVLVDSFGNLDIDRLDELFADDPNYVQPTQAELEALDSIPCVLVDKDYFMIFDALFEFTEQYNGEGLYWQYWYHTWKVFSVSPFANALAFTVGTPDVTGVTVSPATATVTAGQSISLGAVVATDYFAPQSVNWTSSDEDIATVSPSGVVTVNPDATPSDTVTITATDSFTGDESDTCVITVA